MSRILVCAVFVCLNLLAASEDGPRPVLPRPEVAITAGAVEPRGETPKPPLPAPGDAPSIERPETPRSEARAEGTKSPVAKIPEPAGWERYKVLSQRNMFSKDRGRPREDVRREPRRETPPPPRIESDLVLLGVIQRDGQPGAIIENRASGKIVTIKPGEKIGAGVAKTISLDSIDFECDGILHVIRIGSTLAGTVPRAAHAAPASTPATETKTGEAPGSSALPAPASSAIPAPAGSTGGESVLERMRRKRQEEMRK